MSATVRRATVAVPDVVEPVSLTRAQFHTLRHAHANVTPVGEAKYKPEVVDALTSGAPARAAGGALVEQVAAYSGTRTTAGMAAVRRGERPRGGGAVAGRRVWALTDVGRRVLEAFVRDGRMR